MTYGSNTTSTQRVMQLTLSEITNKSDAIPLLSNQIRWLSCRTCSTTTGGGLPDEFLDEITWQELLNGWANQDLGQFLEDDKMILLGHVNRATTHEGVITKHRASAEYRPIAYPTHDSGHYFAILAYRDLVWIADDGGTPTALHFLTPQLAGQIVQVWAVQTSALVTPRQIARALPQPEAPDYDPPLHSKKAKFTQDSMRMHVANITTFGKHTLDWLWSRENELVETHLDKQKHSSLCQYFEVRGRHAFRLPACAQQPHQ